MKQIHLTSQNPHIHPCQNIPPDLGRFATEVEISASASRTMLHHHCAQWNNCPYQRRARCDEALVSEECVSVCLSIMISAALLHLSRQARIGHIWKLLLHAITALAKVSSHVLLAKDTSAVIHEAAWSFNMKQVAAG